MTKNLSIFYPKIVTKLSEIKVGSGTRDPKIRDQKTINSDPDPRVKNAPDPGSGSATLGISMHTAMNCIKKQARSFLIA